jgi:large subunit ribosomal protein L3
VLRVLPARIVQVKTTERDGYTAVQVTYGQRAAKKLTKPEAGHFAKAGVPPRRYTLEIRTADASSYTLGQEVTAEVFAPEGDKPHKVDVVATSKGKGYAGVMKRHNFRGLGAGHGVQRKHRSPGSIGGCSTPGRVFKGMRMAGRMGGVRQTTQNLQIHAVDAERGLLLFKGAVPGPRGGIVLIRTAAKGA